jgi:hypothetical protein
MRGDGCSICADGRPDETAHGLRFLRGEHTDAYLGRHGPSRGYAYVVWRGRHVAEPSERWIRGDAEPVPDDELRRDVDTLRQRAGSL